MKARSRSTSAASAFGFGGFLDVIVVQAIFLLSFVQCQTCSVLIPFVQVDALSYSSRVFLEGLLVGVFVKNLSVAPNAVHQSFGNSPGHVPIPFLDVDCALELL